MQAQSSISSESSPMSSPKLKVRPKKLVRKESTFVFDPYKHMDMTKEQRQNLKELERLEKIEWFIEVVKLRPG